MKLASLLFSLACSLAIGAVQAEESGRLTADEDAQGVLVREGDAQVCYYQRATKSQDGKFARANYLHPVFDLDGRVMTEDFPADHRHHRGIFWAWHQCWVGDQKVGDGWACKDFGWDVTDVKTQGHADGSLSLIATVLWKSPQLLAADGSQRPIVKEVSTIRVYPAKKGTRTFDFEISLLALEEQVRLGGSEDAKGYGGFSLRIAEPQKLSFVGREGSVTPERIAVHPGAWLDMTRPVGGTETTSGMAVLTHSSLPQFPPPWILRKGSSMQNVVWPGREAKPLSTSEPLVLRYRVVLHRGAVPAKTVQSWQDEYSSSQ